MSTGTRTLSRGIETYTFIMSVAPFLRIAEDIKQFGREVAHRHLVDWYCISPRPEASEILESSVRVEEGAAIVTLKIARGHYVLARFLAAHSECGQSEITRLPEGINIFCNTCHETLTISHDALPRPEYPWERETT